MKTVVFSFHFVFLLSFGDLCLSQNSEGERKDENDFLISKLEDFSNRLQALEGLVATLVEGSSNQDNLLEIFQGIIQMEVERGEAIVNRTCSASQLLSLQDSLLTDLKRESSRMEADLKRSIETQTTTIQKELEAVKRESSRIETDLQRSIETQTTTIQTAMLCPFPSALIDGLGCVTPFKEWKNWDDAKADCKAQGSGSRLLEGITSQREMDLLKEKFEHYLEVWGAWLGMRSNPSWQWVESGDSVDPSSSSSSSELWMEGEPDDGDEGCGRICLGCSPPSLWDHPCSSTTYFLCQRI